MEDRGTEIGGQVRPGDAKIMPGVLMEQRQWFEVGYMRGGGRRGGVPGEGWEKGVLVMLKAMIADSRWKRTFGVKETDKGSLVIGNSVCSMSPDSWATHLPTCGASSSTCTSASARGID